MSDASLIVPYVDDATVREAEAIYASHGLTLSDAFRRLVLRTVAEHEIPLDLLRPNAETLAAMAELDSGRGQRFATVAELMADLDADD